MHDPAFRQQLVAQHTRAVEQQSRHRRPSWTRRQTRPVVAEAETTLRLRAAEGAVARAGGAARTAVTFTERAVARVAV